jgi:2-polyprenyl-6-methoxyphenol hydroxylase-like FAD-dependent oxidoreductase
MTPDLTTQCCIAGGGPAGMMAGYLLARSGINVIVLEKHNDFLRDFRGDTIHPSTLQVMHELGLYDRLLARPHQAVAQLKAKFGELEATFADFSHLPTRAKFVAFMPQWDFLEFLATEARSFPSFRLIMRAEVIDVMKEDNRVVGVIVSVDDEVVRLRCELVIGCDGRHSTVRSRAGLEIKDIGAPMDVLWFRLSRLAGDPVEVVGSFGLGHIFVMIDRGDYWQCGYVIAKGSLDDLRKQGLEALRRNVETLAPFLNGRAAEIKSFDDIRLLTVGVDRLTRWHRPGLLCIGDAAHTMSPVGGVGINLAIQDAVAASNLLAGPLRNGGLDEADLARVQQRREKPTRRTQSLQVIIQNNIIKRIIGSPEPLRPPLLIRLIRQMPWLARIPARIIGLGFQPEHVETEALYPSKPAMVNSPRRV